MNKNIFTVLVLFFIFHLPVCATFKNFFYKKSSNNTTEIQWQSKSYDTFLKPYCGAPLYALLNLCAQGRIQDVDTLLVHETRYRKYASGITQLVNATGYPEQEYPISPCDTPLKNALKNGHYNIARMLLLYGARANQAQLDELAKH